MLPRGVLLDICRRLPPHEQFSFMWVVLGQPTPAALGFLRIAGPNRRVVAAGRLAARFDDHGNVLVSWGTKVVGWIVCKGRIRHCIVSSDLPILIVLAARRAELWRVAHGQELRFVAAWSFSVPRHVTNVGRSLRIETKGCSIAFGICVGNDFVIFETCMLPYGNDGGAANKIYYRRILGCKISVQNFADIETRMARPFMFSPRFENGVVWDPDCSHVVLCDPTGRRVVWLDSIVCAVSEDVIATEAFFYHGRQCERKTPFPSEMRRCFYLLNSDAAVGFGQSAGRLGISFRGEFFYLCNCPLLADSSTSPMCHYFPLVDTLLVGSVFYRGILSALSNDGERVCDPVPVAMRAVRMMQQECVVHEPNLISFGGLVFFVDGDSVHWCRLEHANYCGGLLALERGGSVAQVRLRRLGLFDSENDAVAALVIDTEPPSRFALLEAAARRLASSLSALANATDADEFERSDISMESLSCPISNVQQLWPIDDEWFLVGKCRRLTLVSRLDAQVISLPHSWCLKTVNCFASETSLIIASTQGRLVQVSRDDFKISLMNLGGGRKSLHFDASLGWLAAVSQNKITWHCLHGNVRVVREISLNRN